MALVVRTAAPDSVPLDLSVRGNPVALSVRPFSSTVREQAEWAGRAARRALGDEAPEAEAVGAYFAAFVAQLGRSTIVGWDVVDADGAPVPCDPATVEAVLSLNPDFARAFDAAYAAANAVRVAEGNGSGPAPSGISAAGPNTAPAAPTTITAGPAPI
jgi:hypothetical protein